MYMRDDETTRSLLYWMTVGLLCVLILTLSIKAWTQESALFKDRGRVAAFLDSQPERAIDYLQAILTPEQAEALEARMFPPPTPERFEAEMKDVRRQLKELGLADDDAVIQAVDARIATGAAMEADPVEDDIR